jgi:acetyltransferase-like isoleucine patch superfamily enzyme
MGMRIGRRVRITTEFFTDVSMMTVGDDSVIGGSATLFCHYGGGGHLVIAPVVIGRRVTIGERATIMGDVVIGDDARILAHAALLPGTRVGAGEVWGGAPARRIPEDEWARYKLETRGGTQ